MRRINIKECFRFSIVILFLEGKYANSLALNVLSKRSAKRKVRRSGRAFIGRKDSIRGELFPRRLFVEGVQSTEGGDYSRGGIYSGEACSGEVFIRRRDLFGEGFIREGVYSGKEFHVLIK